MKSMTIAWCSRITCYRMSPRKDVNLHFSINHIIDMARDRNDHLSKLGNLWCCNYCELINELITVILSKPFNICQHQHHVRLFKNSHASHYVCCTPSIEPVFQDSSTTENFQIDLFTAVILISAQIKIQLKYVLAVFIYLRGWKIYPNLPFLINFLMHGNSF